MNRWTKCRKVVTFGIKENRLNMAQRSFKTDESFLQKLAIGAVGTRKVIEDLKLQKLHPIVLERGSTGFKIWKSI